MDVFTTPARIIVTCNKWLADYLGREIEALGFTPDYVFPTGVVLKGTLNDCIRLNLNLRCASQILYSLKAFRANDPDQVYRELSEFSWEEILHEDGYFSITNNVSHPTIKNTMFANVKVKDAIVDRLRQITGQRPDTGPSMEEAVIHLYWRDEDAEIFIDTSGETLSKHGYRKIPGKAPMLEALAAATILASKWDRKSVFVNPMCGSSTLAIEAALIATNRVPGLLRDNYAFMHIKGYDEAIYQEELKRIREQVTEVPGLRIIASDISRDAVEISQVNAKIAGVNNLIEFSICDFEFTTVPDSPGVIFFNPEYGERLGDVTELEKTYERIGDFMKKKCQGYMGYIFTGAIPLLNFTMRK